MMRTYHCYAALMLVIVALVEAAPSTCIASKGVSCATEGPRGGGAMIQAVTDTSAQKPPLKGRLVTLEAEVALLEKRIQELNTAVGVTGAAAEAPAAEAAALLETSLFAAYATLLRSKGENLDATVSELETKMRKVNADIQTLQNKVSGNAFSAPSLIAKDATIVDDELAGVSLASRTTSLEAEVTVARLKVSSLEQTTVG